MKLSRMLLCRVWCRLLWLQASWNYEVMQALGLFYALTPALEQLEPEGRRRRARQWLGYFNTHPYLAPSVVGTVLHLTLQDADRGGQLGPRQFVDMVSAPYAAVGDAFFWGAWRPLSAAAALCLAVMGWVWAPLAYVLLFALPRLWFSIGGFYAGIRQGLAAVQWLQRWHLADLAIRGKRAAAVLLGGLCALLMLRDVATPGAVPSWVLLPVPFGILLLSRLVRRGLPVPLLVGLITLVLTAFWLWFGETA